MLSYRVGLFGWYERQNFGDDLMAVLFAKELDRLGLTSLVWRLSPATAAEFGIETVESSDALLEWSDVIVYGGGGLFTNAHGRMESESEFGDQFDRLLSGAEKSGKPVVLLSVGGDGAKTKLGSLQRRAIDLASLITLRNAEDSLWLQAAGKTASVYPDIVWRTAPTLVEPVADESSRNLLLMHNLSSREEKVARFIHSALFFQKRRLRPITFYCENFPDKPVNKDLMVHTTVMSTLEMLSCTRTVLTNRLHLGMAALATGASLVMVRPEPKAQIARTESGVLCPIVSKKHELLRQIYSSLRITGDAARPLPLRQRQKLSQNAFGHIDEFMMTLRRRCNHA